MKTVFGLFDSYEKAEEAVTALVKKEFSEAEMNAIVQEETAKSAMEVNLEKVGVAMTEKVGAKNVGGLDALVGGQQPVTVPSVGEVYAAGEMATIVAKTAAAPGTDPGEFQAVLVEFGVPEEVAKAYVGGIQEDGLLFWIRVDDEREAEAIALLNEHKGTHVGSY
jgi:hypothetical protein